MLLKCCDTRRLGCHVSLAAYSFDIENWEDLELYDFELEELNIAWNMSSTHKVIDFWQFKRFIWIYHGI